MAAFVIGFVVVAAIFWMVLCNERTYAERCRLIDFVFAQEDCWPALRALWAVSYDDHYRCRLWLRDPRQLYPRELAEAI